MEKEQEVMVETAEAAAPVENTAKRKSNASVPVDQFDWDSFEEDSSEADRKADEEKYNQTLSKVVENEVVEGTVMAVGKREVLVNIGYKSEGVINISEFRYNPDIKVGDKVEVYVETEGPADSLAQKGTLTPFMGSRERGLREGRDRQGLC